MDASKEIKNYFEWCKRSVGLTSKELADKLDLTPVHLCNLSSRLEMLPALKLAQMAKIFGETPGNFLDTILQLRNDPTTDIYASRVSKEFRTKIKHKSPQRK